ncbi:hypothetical protein ACTNCL_07445, partial [Segatella copri]|uniref:hypothetical protein n=1 Tax=Segatella copri TaxID=165179 RepID=UPI003F8A0ECF
ACSDTSGTDCSDSMVPITPLRVVPIQRYRHLMRFVPKMNGVECEETMWKYSPKSWGMHA